MSFPVFLDTCAIFGAALADLTLRLAERSAFRPLWSEAVLEELERNLAIRIGDEAAERRVSAMRTAFPEASVTGFEALIEKMPNHPKDRHVLAAAVRADAELIVTFNLKDFDAAHLEPFDIVARHPDEFLLDQFDLYPDIVLDAVQRMADEYESPPITPLRLLELLERDVPAFASTLRSEF